MDNSAINVEDGIQNLQCQWHAVVTRFDRPGNKNRGPFFGRCWGMGLMYLFRIFFDKGDPFLKLLYFKIKSDL
jgi:hypothetical protein